MQHNGCQRLAEALVFAHGDHAFDEAKRHYELNSHAGNLKMAAEWACALKLVNPAQIEFRPETVVQAA